MRPDIYILGKALGGGIMPISAVVSSREILSVFTPGDHGSTFGGNPLASAVGEAALDVIVNERLAEKAERSGRYLMKRLASINGGAIKEVRGKGLLIGIEIKQSAGPARPYCERLMKLGVLVKETHVRVIRLAPPLIITMEEIDWLAERMQMVLGN